jgi:peptidoglycan/xylan/chitin deacetylase (PgdA/CDA1 family)
VAVFRARALVVAAGVPAAFALLAGILAGPGAFATAAEAATPTARPAPLPASASVPAPLGGLGATERTAPTDRPAAAPATLPVSSHLSITDPVAFITVDDGVTKDAAALTYVEARHLPVTAFLTAWTVKDRAAYFERITHWGSIQNHSATHANFTDPTTDLNHEICYTQRALTKDFGAAPWLLRPPYGAGGKDPAVQSVAAGCGIQHIVLWDAYVQNGTLTKSGHALHAGSILLMHFSPNLAQDLKAAVRAITKAGLRPANLADYLPRHAS